MKTIATTSRGIVVTGASGFVGCHLREQLARMENSAVACKEADILDSSALGELAGENQWRTVIHLAGYGRVVAPVSLAPPMFNTAIAGTLNVLKAFSPGVIVVASTCAVYGNAVDAVAGKTTPNPLGLYGISKVATESLAIDWARETGQRAVITRFGNVIGSGCGGLIPYLVDHAVKFPDAEQPARLRGGGRIIRDYVPVSHVVQLLAVAGARDWTGEKVQFFNIGSGRGLRNGEVAEEVIRILNEMGYRLRVEYAPEPAPGEARQAILNIASTTDVLGAAPPSETEVLKAISQSVQSRLERTIGSSLVVGR